VAFYVWRKETERIGCECKPRVLDAWFEKNATLRLEEDLTIGLILREKLLNTLRTGDGDLRF